MSKQSVVLALIASVTSFSASAVPEGPAFPSAAWLQREAANYAKVGEAPREQASNPVFMQRLNAQSLINTNDWIFRGATDPSWLAVPSGNTSFTPLCTTWGIQCAGDPFRYPDYAGQTAGLGTIGGMAPAGVDGQAFYSGEAQVIPVVYYDEECARISGRVWAPRNVAPGALLPNVIIENGSVQAPEPLYWWMAQALVRSGYVVMTFDPRGQGRSDQQTPTGVQGSNANSAVFFDGLVNAIDFFRSTPAKPYPHNLNCAGTYPTVVTAYNPLYALPDPARLGLAGHSLGASGVSTIQGYGSGPDNPWPGLIDTENPVKVVVAWDSLSAGAKPRVPAMGQSSEYGLTPRPFTSPPNVEGHKNAYTAWKDAGVPVFQLTIQGSSHYEWSLIPTFPTTSWCPKTSNNRCEGGWGRPLAEHYSMAWFDRWLKKPGEMGYETADARLLDDSGPQGRNKFSFYYKSARNFRDRDGVLRACEDIRAGGC